MPYFPRFKPVLEAGGDSLWEGIGMLAEKVSVPACYRLEAGIIQVRDESNHDL